MSNSRRFFALPQRETVNFYFSIVRWILWTTFGQPGKGRRHDVRRHIMTCDYIKTPSSYLCVWQTQGARIRARGRRGVFLREGLGQRAHLNQRFPNCINIRNSSYLGRCHDYYLQNKVSVLRRTSSRFWWVLRYAGGFNKRAPEFWEAFAEGPTLNNLYAKWEYLPSTARKAYWARLRTAS